MRPGPRVVEPQDPGTWDPGPPQILKVGPGGPLKFKSGTSGPPSKFKSGTPGPTMKFKSGTPHHHSLNEFIFFQNISSFFLLILCLF